MHMSVKVHTKSSNLLSSHNHWNHKMLLDPIENILLKALVVFGLRPTFYKSFLRLDTLGPVFSKAQLNWINSVGKVVIQRSFKAFTSPVIRKSKKLSVFHPLPETFDFCQYICINKRKVEDPSKIKIPSFTRELFLSQFPSSQRQVSSLRANITGASNINYIREEQEDLPIMSARPMSAAALRHPTDDVASTALDNPAILEQNVGVSGIQCHFRVNMEFTQSDGLFGGTGFPFNAFHAMCPRGTNKDGIFRDVYCVVLPLPGGTEDMALCYDRVPTILPSGLGMIVDMPTGKLGNCELINESMTVLAADTERFGDKHEARDSLFAVIREGIRSHGLGTIKVCLMFPEGIRVTTDHFHEASKQVDPYGLTTDVLNVRKTVMTPYGAVHLTKAGWVVMMAIEGREEHSMEQKKILNPLAERRKLAVAGMQDTDNLANQMKDLRVGE